MIGRIIKDLAPESGNNRNSEGGFITLKNGDILFIYSRYRDGGKGDDCAADLYGIISKDMGESFGEPFPILKREDTGADNLMSVSLLRLNNGDIGLFYLHKNNNEKQCIPYLIRSSDEGEHWSEPLRIIESSGYYVLNNDRVIRLAGGRLLMAVAKHSGELFLGRLYIYASDDDGKSWRQTLQNIPLPVSVRNFKQADSAMEPGLVQLKSGMIWCCIRTHLGCQYEMYSYDNGENWTLPGPSRFTSPTSPMSFKRLSDNRIIVVWNPVPTYTGRSTTVNGVWTGGRTPLLLAVMDEDAKEFLLTEKVETDEDRGFCYCAIHELEDGAVMLGYCAGGEADGSTLCRLRIRKIDKNELLKAPE